MFATYVSVALLAVSSVSGLVVPRTPKQPANWWKGLESYTEYNARYNALGCVKKHNTPFFDACCHPLLKSQSLSSRPAQCTPGSVSATVTATSAAPSATDDDDDCDDGPETSATITATSVAPSATDDDDDDCDDGPESSSATLTATSAAPTTTDDGDDDCEPCDDDDPDNCEDVPFTSTLAASSTPAPTFSSVSPTVTSSSIPVSTPKSSSSSKSTPSTTVTPTSTPASSSTPAPSSTPATTSAKPIPTTTKVSTTSSTPAPTPSSPASGSSPISGGFATYYFQNGAAGACGDYHSDNDFIAAIDERRYGNPGLKSKLCGQQVRVTNTKNKKSVVVTIKDDCPTCENKNSIDLSRRAFNTIATEEEGMVPITLEFL